MRKIILTLILIMFICGCTIPDVLKQMMPGFEQQEVKELPPDIITVQSLNILPTPPINTEDEFSVSFILKNQDDTNEVGQVKYNLFDSGLCDRAAGDDKALGTLVPLQEEFVEWTFRAPTNDQIAQISTKCPIRFKVDYNFDARSQIDVNVISQSRLTELQRAGEGVTFTPTLTVGRGPVKIYLSFGASLPVKSGNKLPLYILVEDKGDGLYSLIPDEEGKRLVIEAPGFDATECVKDGKFTRSDSRLVSDGAIPLIRKKTVQLRCSLTAPAESFEKTYYITASLNYDYTITEETEVAVNPTG